MILAPNGLDIFYIDESHDKHVYVVTCVAIPFLRPQGKYWKIVWPDFLTLSKAWRRRINQDHKIPQTKELHGLKLASGRGNFFKGKYNFDKSKASGVYRKILNNLNWLRDTSIMSAAATRGYSLYGNKRLEGAMYALFQRMRSKCVNDNVNAITFFDEGHPEYRRLYRQAQVYLPTGSMLGGWTSGLSRNLPLNMFTKDANEKNSKHCYFTQIADIIAYAAFLKIKYEHRQLEEWQQRYNWQTAYDEIPTGLLNTRASSRKPRDAIVRLLR